MKYQLYKLKFYTGVHFGDGSLTKSKGTVCADTIFSAMCIEALKMGTDVLEQLVDGVKNHKILISDGHPFIGDVLYLPRPMMELGIERGNSSAMKKAIKNLEYIPAEQLDDYIKGNMDVEDELYKFQNSFGSSCLVEKASIPDGEECRPFAVDVFTYTKDSGLYIIVGYIEDKDMNFIEEILIALSLTGIGGKRTSGYGKFLLESGALPGDVLERLQRDYKKYMALSICLPTDDELDEVVQHASFRLIRRSGFVLSETYAENMQKKKDTFLMTAGTTTSVRFRGQLLDVANGGRHPVYRYASAMLLGVI